MGSLHWPSLLLSLEIAAIACVFSTIVGGALGLLLAWRKLPASDLIDAVCAAPLVLPPTVLGYYLLVLLGAHSSIGRAFERVTGSTIVFSMTGAVIAGAVGSLPLVIKAARHAFECVDPTYVAAARSLGAGPWRRFVTVLLPLAAPGILAGAMLAFARALGDFGITMMIAATGLRADGTKPASIFIYDAIQANREGDAATMAVAITVLAIALLYGANRLTRRLRA